MDTEARHRIVIRLFQRAHPDDWKEVFGLARMIRTEVPAVDLLDSASLAPIIDRCPGLHEELEELKAVESTAG